MELRPPTTRWRRQILRQNQTKLIFQGVKPNCQIFSLLLAISYVMSFMGLFLKTKLNAQWAILLTLIFPIFDMD